MVSWFENVILFRNSFIPLLIQILKSLKNYLRGGFNIEKIDNFNNTIPKDTEKKLIKGNI
jgi:hypothetical protein